MVVETDIEIKENLLRSDFDHPWKQGLQLYFQDFMEFCLPEIAAEIDWSKGYESLDKELQAITRDSQTGNRIADKLIKVYRKNGKETFVLCHLEVDGNPKGKIPPRMLTYRYRIHDLRQLPIISIAILIDDDPNWRVDYYREECFGTYLEIKYIVIKLLDYRERRQELEAMNNRFAMVMLAQLTALETKQDSKARLYEKTALTRLLYKKGYHKKDIIELFMLIDWLIKLPKNLEKEYNQEIKQIQQEKEMGQYISTPERVGRREGFKKGRVEGIVEGLHQGEAAVLTRLLQRRFGQLPNYVSEKIQQADIETLLIWSERVLDVNSLQEIFN